MRRASARAVRLWRTASQRWPVGSRGEPTLSAATRAGTIVLTAIIAAALAAPWLAPNDPNERFEDLMYAPPVRMHLFEPAEEANGRPAAGRPEGRPLRTPYIHPLRVLSLRERTFEEDRSRAVPIRWFTRGHLVTADPENGAPLLLLGADSYGRDVFSRLLHGARLTLLVAVIATAGATLLGALIGGIAGQSSGWLDAMLSRITEFVLVLPAIYVALSLRGVMPLVLSASTVFLMLTGIFTLLGWPIVARGVRAIVLAERQREYAVAALAAGASDVRLLSRHLLPAAGGYILTQATLLLPAFILAEATMSFVGLGFPSDVATWGTMLQEAQNVAALADMPWTLAPALAIFLVVLGVNLVVQGSGRAPVQVEP